MAFLSGASATAGFEDIVIRVELKIPVLIVQLLLATLVVSGTGEGSLILAPAPPTVTPKPSANIANVAQQPCALRAARTQPALPNAKAAFTRGRV